MEATGTIKPGNNEGNRTSARTVDQASTGVHDATSKASDAARPVLDRIAAGAHQAVDKIAAAAGQAAETLGAKSEQLANAQAKGMEQARGYIREHPVMVLGIAIAAGFVLSRLLNSR